MKASMHPGTVYDKFTNGDDLTDAEVKFGSKYFLDLGKQLTSCGATFRLAGLEAYRVGRQLQDFSEARARNAKAFSKRCTTRSIG